MRKFLLYFNIIALITLISIYTVQRQSVPTVQFFPVDPLITFDYAETSLMLSNKESPYTLVWESKSKTNEPVYLRQDVSLLYNNGKLIGLRSKWEEDVQEMRLKELVQRSNNGYFQAISFHHGESHYNENDIKSIQQMTHDQLFVTKQNSSQFEAIRTLPGNRIAKKLDKQIKQSLLSHWNELINHFHIDIDHYSTVPLIHLDQAYLVGTLPVPEKYAKQIIGQLWEGLYKNYVLPSIKTNYESFVPVILFAKDNTHLIVLFTINNKYEKLLQQYPDQNLN